MKNSSLADRLSAAKSARQATISKYLQRPGHDDPAVAARRAAREAVSAAREVRVAEREAARVAEETRRAVEREKQAADAAAVRVAEAERAAADNAASAADRELKLKAARDARYAARKARK
jgi:hypothetical protein